MSEQPAMSPEQMACWLIDNLLTKSQLDTHPYGMKMTVRSWYAEYMDYLESLPDEDDA